MMKTRILLGSVTCLSLLLSGEVSFAAQQKSTVDVTVWTSPDTIAVKWFKPEIAQFEKLHPTIHVTVLQEGNDNNYAKYTAAIAGNRAPDLILTYGYAPIPTWASSGLLLPMDPYLKQLHFNSSTFFPFINAMDTFHGHTWGLVQAYDDLLFTWNKQAFKAAGLNPNKPPRTLDELWADAKRLTKFKNGKLVQAGFIPWLELGGDLGTWDNLEGGSIYDSKQAKWTINTPQMNNAMNLFAQYNKLLGGSKQWESLIEKGVGSSTLTPSSSPLDPFYKGQVAMQLVGDWYPVFVYKVYAPKLQYGEAPPPVAKGVKYGTNTTVGTDVFTLPKGSQHPLEATELALFLDRKESAIAWDSLESNMPPIQAAGLSPAFLKQVPTEWPSVMAAKKHLLIPYASAGLLNEVTGTILPNIAQQLEYGKISPSQAATESQQNVDQQEAMFKTEHPQWFQGQ